SGFDIEDETFIADVTEMIDAAKEEQDARIVIDIVKEAEKKGLLNEKKEDKKIDEKDIDKYIIAMHEDVSKELEKEESDPGWNVKLDMRDGSVEVCIKYNDIDDTKEFVLDNKYTVFTRISNHIEQFVPRLKVIINIRPEAQQELFSGSVIRFIHNGKIIVDYKEGATVIAVPDTIETVDEYIDLVMNSYKKNKE
ncbi:MAG: hypothetical protein KAH32_04165, partial [Chlamydiia bacterium]|nr:hypothetical protein [Chlamydiia bacterium]